MAFSNKYESSAINIRMFFSSVNSTDTKKYASEVQTITEFRTTQ